MFTRHPYLVGGCKPYKTYESQLMFTPHPYGILNGFDTAPHMGSEPGITSAQRHKDQLANLADAWERHCQNWKVGISIQYIDTISTKGL